jgi:hypothetical protein
MVKKSLIMFEQNYKKKFKPQNIQEAIPLLDII